MGRQTDWIGSRAAAVPPSLIRLMYDRAQEVPGAISLAVGEPDFPTPPHIVEAGRAALREGFTRYSPNQGYLDLREAIAEKLRKANGIEADPGTQVFVTVGAMQALMLTFMVALDPGDEVLLTDPSYCNFTGQVTLAGARPVLVPTEPERGYLPDVAAMEAALTPRTRAILLNSPANPTGAVCPRDLLREIADLAVRHDLLVVSDETYAALVYGDIRHVSLAGAFPEVADRTVSIYSFSKEYAMTGWRIGYLAGPAPMLRVMATVQEQMASCVNAATQRAALAALRGPQDCVEAMRRAYERRRDRVVERLNGLPGVRCPRPDGAFYVFPDVRAMTRETTALAGRLLTEHGVVVSPGEAFGPRSAGFLRLSYAASDEALEAGLDRLAAGLGGAATD
jgi:aspartate/methionine/tyrosine aminotransferase